MENRLYGTIDRKSYEPAYVQLSNILRQQIASGVYRPDDKLPSEAELCRHFEVSPMTVRRVINILSDQGIVSTIQGRGTYVKSFELGNASFQLDTLQQLFKNEKETTLKILEARIASADASIADLLKLKENDRVVFIRRLISNKNEPILYHREYLIYDPNRPLIEAEMEVTSLQGIFSGSGKSGLKCGEISISATLLTDTDAKLLSALPLSAAIRLEHIFYDFNNLPVSWGWFLCPGDRLEFKAKIGVTDQ